jgi:hypothetical protein
MELMGLGVGRLSGSQASDGKEAQQIPSEHRRGVHPSQVEECTPLVDQLTS